jgi:hypothetical protein
VKTRDVVGYVAVALAYAYGCGGSSPSFSPSSTMDDGGDDGGAVESGGDDGGGLTVMDAGVTDGSAGDASQRKDASSGSEGGADDGATGAPYWNSSQSCCVSGAYYVCPSTAALAQCTSACTHDPSMDSTCIAIDAGSTSASTGSNTAPAPPAPQTNSCGGFFLGIACMMGGQCYGSNEHCSGGTCYLNDVGNPCTYPNDCGSGNHCTSGCCQNSAKGSPCDAPWDCKSNTCTNHVCQ